MRLKRLLLSAGGVLLLIAAAAVLLDVPLIVEGYLRHESFFQGKPTSYWKLKLDNRDEDYKLAVKQFKRGGPAAVPVLVEALKDEKILVREGAARALGELGPGGRTAVPALEAALADTDGRVRLNVARTLRQLDPGNARIGPALIDTLKDPDAKIRDQTATALKQLAAEADRSGSRLTLRALVRALKDQDGLTRVQAADILSQVQAADVGLVPILVESLRDGRWEVRKQAAVVLGRVVPRVHPAALAVLSARTVGSLASAAGTRPLLAASALVPGSTQQAITALVGTLRDDHPEVRGWSIWALGNIGPAAREAVPAIERASKDPDANVRRAAAIALVRIRAGAPGKPRTR